jgi:lysophospholipase L1-like esterase
MHAGRFEYTNVPTRPLGRGLRLLSSVSPGVRGTLADVEPYAKAWSLHNERAATTSGPLWLVLGDSMAQGIGASAFDRGWVGQLADQLDPAYRMINLSFHGARVPDVLERQWATAVTLGEPALVTLLIGSNDIASRTLRRSVVANYADLIGALPDGAVIATLPNPFRTARAINRMVIEAGRDRGMVVADLRPLLHGPWRGQRAADHFHPNDDRYAAIARVFAAAIAAGRAR